MSLRLENPVLTGFHADPSMIRVGEDFYLAVSTFEWFPGVLIYHSRDLVHWRLAARPLDRLDLLDMRGEEASCGVWAPCLSHDGEQFHLVYSDVKNKKGPFWDVSNYVITAPSIEGPWSDRIFLNRCGFDPSLFHDEDGRKWVLTLTQDLRPGANRFGGIELQEYCPSEKRLIGEPRIIFRGTALACTEGPHLYRHRGWYFLVCAEGGTGWKHAVTVARSKDIQGPYEVHPGNPILTSFEKEGVNLHKAGHASWADDGHGNWFMAHLCSRPIGEHRRCILGRETAIQAILWGEDDWPRLANGGSSPDDQVEVPALQPHPFPVVPERVDFSGPDLPPEFQTLREPPHPSWLSLEERPGWVRLYGRYSLYSNFEQSTVGRRVQHHHCWGETLLDFQPVSHQQSAGLAAFYDDNAFFYLSLTFEPGQGRLLRLVRSVDGQESYPLGLGDNLPDEGKIRLAIRFAAGKLFFFWATEKGPWQEIPYEGDATLLSDDFGPRYRFTGAFFVLTAQDCTQNRTPADFGYFRYRPEDGKRFAFSAE